MTSTLLPSPTAKPDRSVTVKKVTGSFPSRKAAQVAVLALRQAGYGTKEIQILRGVPAGALEQDGVYEALAKYVRHLVNPKRILIRVTSTDIDRASLLFRNLGAEVAVNRFFHQTTALGSGTGRGAAILPVRRWSE